MRVLVLLASLLLLVACSGHPDPAPTAPTPRHYGGKTLRGGFKSLSSASTSAPTPASSSSGCASASEQKSIPTFDYYGLHERIDSLLSVGDRDGAVALLKLQVNVNNSIDELGRRTVQLAHLLSLQGQDEKAQAQLDAFLVYKPLLLHWLDSAEALERHWRPLAPDTLSLHPVTKQIANLMATRADYPTIRSWTDSLRGLPITDSLRKWSVAQDSIALARSRAKVSALEAEIYRLVLEDGAFAKATSMVEYLRGLPAEMVGTIAPDSLLAWIASTSKSEASAADPGYWKAHDPLKSLTEARALKDTGKIDQAKGILRKLLQTSLRKEARAELSALGEVYCEKKRQVALEKYSRSRKSKSAEDALGQLDLAIQTLDACLEEFPETAQRTKVLQNKDLLQQEKRKWNKSSP